MISLKFMTTGCRGALRDQKTPICGGLAMGSFGIEVTCCIVPGVLTSRFDGPLFMVELFVGGLLLRLRFQSNVKRQDIAVGKMS